MMSYRNHAEVEPHEWPWRHFLPVEMADRTTGELVVAQDFMDWLEAIRLAYGKPIVLNSGYRTPLHQWELTGRYTGAHVDGMAGDVRVWGEDAHMLLRVAYGHGVLGVGVSQIGPVEKRYVHLDRWTKAPEGLRPRLWNY
ncbi:MAG: D-Ala-D-Ala carboxypeptidase family metallohydrolase [Geminicoccaceae bacterium]